MRTFNVVYLAMMALTAWCTARLAYRLCGRSWEAWLAGVAFAFSPVLMARSTAHFSLVAAAPLPVILLIMVNGEGKGRARDAIALGATLAWAAFCDIYYAVYGALLITAWVLASAIAVSRRESPVRSAFLRRLTRGLMIVAATFVAVVALQGGLIQVAGLRISMRSLYTPMLVLTRAGDRAPDGGLAANGPMALSLRACAPVARAGHGADGSRAAVASARRVWRTALPHGQMAGPDIYWRSSPAGRGPAGLRHAQSQLALVRHARERRGSSRSAWTGSPNSRPPCRWSSWR